MLLLTSSTMENTQDLNDNDGDDKIGLKLSTAGSAQTTRHTIQIYMVKCIEII